MLTRRCGFLFTTTGRPCGNRVGEDAPWCRAGHPCAPVSALDDAVPGAPSARESRNDPRARRSGTAPFRRDADIVQRATALVRRALSSDDAELHGTRADHILGDEGAALMLLGSPAASEPARAGVVQRFGLVGALLVVGFEERWRGCTTHGGAPRGVLHRGHKGAVALVDTLVRDFPKLDQRQLERLLRQLERCAGTGHEDEVARAHRMLHATYALAARDGTDRAHRAYLRALDRVLRLVGPLVIP